MSEYEIKDNGMNEEDMMDNIEKIRIDTIAEIKEKVKKQID